jgi:hypothetical protein
MNCYLGSAIAMSMMMQGATMTRFDEMFTTGPETLVAQAHAIVTGPVSGYSKEVKEQSQGSAPIPVRWVISGQLEHPETLKGDAPKNSLRFSCEEQSPFLPPREPVPTWQGEYSQWRADDKAVAFLGQKPGEILLVLPSGTGQRDLISLVRLIVSIHARSESAQVAAWQRHLLNGAASGAESKRIALRSLMKLTRNWSDVASTLQEVMSEKDADLRRYAYGIVAYEIVHDKWSDAAEPAQFLCMQLAKETNAEIVESHRQYIDLVLRFANEEDFRERRKALRDQLRSCLKEH